MTGRSLLLEPRWLSEPTLLAIHAQQVERYGGAHGILDEEVVLSSLAEPINRWSGTRTTDLADLAAAYLIGLAGSRGFRDGNKRTGLACALVFLSLNEAPLRAAPVELHALIVAAATHQVDASGVARFFRGRLR